MWRPHGSELALIYPLLWLTLTDALTPRHIICAALVITTACKSPSSCVLSSHHHHPWFVCFTKLNGSVSGSGVSMLATINLFFRYEAGSALGVGDHHVNGALVPLLSEICIVSELRGNGSKRTICVDSTTGPVGPAFKIKWQNRSNRDTFFCQYCCD